MSHIPLLYGSLTVSVIKAEGLKDSDGWGGGSSDPYCQVLLDAVDVAQTKVCNENQNPEFDEGK